MNSRCKLGKMSGHCPCRQACRGALESKVVVEEDFHVLWLSPIGIDWDLGVGSSREGLLAPLRGVEAFARNHPRTQTHSHTHAPPYLGRGGF